MTCETDKLKVLSRIKWGLSANIQENKTYPLFPHKQIYGILCVYVPAYIANLYFFYHSFWICHDKICSFELGHLFLRSRCHILDIMCWPPLNFTCICITWKIFIRNFHSSTYTNTIINIIEGIKWVGFLWTLDG